MLRMPKVTLDAVSGELEQLLPPDGLLQYRVASEYSPGESLTTTVSAVLDPARLAERIVGKFEMDYEKTWGRKPS
jgi:hypothetical protein